MEITVKINYYSHAEIEDKYIASIEVGPYKGHIVAAKSIAGCFKELGKSIYVSELYQQLTSSPNNTTI